ncbi:MAG: aminoacyl-tRNA hydrolase [Eubacteriales bacterium]
MADIFELFKKIQSTEKKDAGKPEFIIAGLGNPGEKYTYTRHNAGFLCADFLSQKLSCPIKTLKFKSLYGITNIGEHRVMLLKPQTYMNASGDAIGEAAEFYQIPPENIIIISDDIYLAPGRMRVRKSGSHGGHNGLKSITERLGSENFPRIRIGVGEKPNPEYELADWVLGKIPKEDEEKLFSVFGVVFENLPLIIDGKIDEAMGKCNGVRF